MRTYEDPKLKVATFQGMISTSAKMAEFFALVRRVAATDSPILVRGETGTGKELVARAIHSLSLRSRHNFGAVNCAMLAPELAGSELFGHTKGSFTGATSHHKGYFEESHKGTLFLDEVAELPLSVQSRLLRALQEKVITPLGATKSKPIDVRILSATHKALRREVRDGKFREDLMYRLRVVPIYLPRLVERGRDIEALAWKFIEEYNRYNLRRVANISAAARNALLSYEWPGNVRELRNNIEYAFAVGEGDTLSIDELTPELRGEEPPGASTEDEVKLEVSQAERNRIIKALNKAEGHKGEAAESLEMSRSTLWRKMKTLGIS